MTGELDGKSLLSSQRKRSNGVGVGAAAADKAQQRRRSGVLAEADANPKLGGGEGDRQTIILILKKLEDHGKVSLFHIRP